MPSSTAIVLEFLGDAAGRFDSGDQVAHVLQVHVAGTNWSVGMALAMIGFARESPSVMPVARHRARAAMLLAMGGCCRRSEATYDVRGTCSDSW